MKEFVLVEGYEPTKISRDGTIISRYGKILKHYACKGHYARVGNKLNNSLDNLEWCTSDQNMKHAQSKGLLIKGTQIHTNRLDEVHILTIRKCLSDGLRRKYLAKYFKVAIPTIDAIATRRNWKHL